MAVITRAAMIVVAVAAIAWLAIWLHDARLFARASEATLHARTQAQVEAAIAELGRAGRHSPSTITQTGAAYLMVRSGQSARGARLLERVAREEPRNPGVWSLLAIADERIDPARAAYAAARFRQLIPPVAPART